MYEFSVCMSPISRLVNFWFTSAGAVVVGDHQRVRTGTLVAALFIHALVTAASIVLSTLVNVCENSDENRSGELKVF